MASREMASRIISLSIHWALLRSPTPAVYQEFGKSQRGDVVKGNLDFIPG